VPVFPGCHHAFSVQATSQGGVTAPPFVKKALHLAMNSHITSFGISNPAIRIRKGWLRRRQTEHESLSVTHDPEEHAVVYGMVDKATRHRVVLSSPDDVR